MDLFFDSLADGLLDSLKLVPFLFLTYLIMEWVEKKTEHKQAEYVKKAGKFGPAIGGALGVVPQCGFSCVAANFYSGGIITVGVLLAVFMSTSDEMLPIFISHTVNIGTVVKILLCKLLIAVATGYAVDILNRQIKNGWKQPNQVKSGKKAVEAAEKLAGRVSVVAENTGYVHGGNHHACVGNAKDERKYQVANTHDTAHEHHIHGHHFHEEHGEKNVHSLCEQEHCNCEDGIVKSSIKHTIKVTCFIFVVSVIINILIGIVGEETIKQGMESVPVVSEAVAALVGLIPNCASSVIITELYLDGMLSSGAMMSGLLVSAGVGMLVLFRMNKHRIRENLKVVGTLYSISVLWGIIINIAGINF